jgi:hypothetical protein
VGLGDDHAAVDDRAVDSGVGADADAGRRAGNEPAVQKNTAQDRAAGDGDAAGPDRTGIGDAAAKGGVADHHRGRVTAELGRIWPRERHGSPSMACHAINRFDR